MYEHGRRQGRGKGGQSPTPRLNLPIPGNSSPPLKYNKDYSIDDAISDVSSHYIIYKIHWPKLTKYS